MSDGFIGRWSKRKLDVKEGKGVEAEPPSPSPQPSPASGRGSVVTPEGKEVAAFSSEEAVLVFTPEGAAVAPSPLRGEGRGEGQPVEVPPLTLDDVRALTSDSDFRRFAAADVAPEVKNAAMKKLFADPRYNVMDGMDIYIDDYSKPDPIPQAMLRQLVSAKFLGLFDREEKEEAEAAAAQAAAAGARDVADNPTAETVAQSEPPPPAVPEPTEHADPDLRLQQDDAPAGEDPGRGTE